MMHSLSRLLPLLLLAAALAPASKPSRAAAAPEPAGTRSPALASGIVKRTLPNGLRVLVWPRHTAPVVTTMMWYRVGSRDELPGSTGTAHFLEHLLFKGTRKLARGEIDRLTYEGAGSNNAFTFNDYTAYEFSFPKQSWRRALAIEADRMRNCVLDPGELEAERQVVMEERRAVEDDPAQAFGEQLNSLAFLAHPYRNPVIGWMEDLRRVTRAEILAFYRRYYVPANATLVIAGDVTPREAVGAARAAFAAVPALPAPERPRVAEPAAPSGTRSLRLTLPTRVPRLGVLFRLPPRNSPESYALQVLRYVLAGGKLSRLHQRLVERDAAAAVEADLGLYREAGELLLHATAREGASLERIEAALWEELDRLGEAPIAAAELERARNMFYAEWVQGLETAGDLASVLGEADAAGGYEYVKTLLPRTLAVTAEEVRRAARRFLRRDRAVVGYLHPREAADAPAAGRSPAPGDAPRRAGRGGARDLPGARSAPAASLAPDFPPLKPLEKLLPNGMRLILLENRDLPSVTFAARVDAGQYRDPDERGGLAALAARLLEEGAGGKSHDEIAAALEQAGASFSAAAGRETTRATLRVLKVHAAALLPLFAELLRSPLFPEQRLEQERARVLVELREEADDAFTVARRAFGELVYGDHPGARPPGGTEATVRGITRADLRAFHGRFYRPENTTLAVVGDFRAPAMLAALESAFSGWERGSGPPPPPLPAVSRQREKRIRRIPLEKVQTQLLLGHLGIPRSSPDYTTLRVLDAILGEGVAGGFTARIPYQLRDVQGLAYSVGSSITAGAAREPGLFLAALGTEPASEERALAGLLREIRRIREAPVTPAELAGAVRYLAGSSVFEFQTHGQLADYLLAAQYHGLGYDHRRRFVRDLRGITRRDVQRAARIHLDPEHYSLVTAGPAKAAAGEKGGKP